MDRFSAAPLSTVLALLVGAGAAHAAHSYVAQELPAPWPAMAGDIGDLNGDGLLDIACGYYRNPATAQENYVYWGDGDRQFSFEHAFGAYTAVLGMRVGDFNSDDRLDVLSLHVLTEYPSVLYLGTADGFSPQVVDLAPGTGWGGDGCQGLAVGDLDGDGDLDAASGQRGGGLYISVNDGNGSFTRTQLSAGGTHDAVEIADMDGDGNPDVVDSGPVEGWSGHAAIYWNSGDATFADRTLLHRAREHWGVSVADVDGDEDLDIAMGLGAGEGAVIYLNGGDRQFDLQGTFQSHKSVVLADLDGDGVPELITSGLAPEDRTGEGGAGCALHIYWSAFPGEAPDEYVLSDEGVFDQRRTINVADLDGDGLPDIFVGGPKSGNFILWAQPDGATDDPMPRDKLPELPGGKAWQRVWNDEFYGDELDESKWDVPPDGPRLDGHWERQAISLDGEGSLAITCLKGGDKWVSGCVRTKGKFEHAFGYYVARVKLQQEPGHWSAFWLFNDCVHQVGDEGRDGTEIDIYEKPFLDGRVQHALHWDGYDEEHKSTKYVSDNAGVMDGWHTFSVWWSPEEYVFYVDGEETWRTDDGGVCQAPLYIKLSDEIGDWAGDIADAKLPDAFYVDYVRVYDVVDAR